jgi:hypothetical protein
MQDPSKTKVGVYGYAVMYKLKPDDVAWMVDQDDEYRNLPAHYLAVEEALDRAAFLRTKQIQVRIAALLAEPTDTAEEFSASRIEP